ncbi:hypothetical protein HBH56_103240 [Parastagonospora nodorum]|uniref:RING-type domain-containing protein n=2 Tax=Phaeosphaeria nodorum (strain SN15 / ATCC MYA-4574 / FGSC 10173) TaxID=321614 RepID=A0A7U2I8H5_PHANO|nr:hypothetical protein SNOG_10530 [Parastagonospora nodorum SN15]KAH3913452.1 hypothetical protein HBH56_103240 [Parastagonospora nodorum]EAT81924.1 hypothetical protein SNOG_10530 [Parastagonospora nodorum SN15]KAH3929211.1 hypothetical protein HBH54_127170 [Parastagonospora nodorum]KAH3999369.1 hypothetical protein HBI10_119240 [Parastagonospora nodorum]KAH4025143.1 hypothetical protein HBI13_077950 [Parastagonospora nodorum]
MPPHHVHRQNGPEPETDDLFDNDVSGLRSQSEFFLGGVIPVGAQPDNCCICTDSLATDVVQITACRHCHHLTCILTWWKSSAARRGSCPLCREELFEPDPPAAHVPSLHGIPFQPRDRYTSLGAVRAYTNTQDGQARLRGFMDAVEEHALYATLGENVPATTGGPSYPLIGFGGNDQDREGRRTLLEGHPLYQVYMNGQRARTARRTAQARRDLQREPEGYHSPGHSDSDEDDTTSPVASYYWSDSSSETPESPSRDTSELVGLDEAALIDANQGTESSSASTNTSTPQVSPRANENSNTDTSSLSRVEDQQPSFPGAEEAEEEYLIDYSDDPLQEELERAEAGRRTNEPSAYDAWDDPNARTAVRYGLIYRRDHNENWCIREPTDEEEADEDAARQRSNGNNWEMDDELLSEPEELAGHASDFAQNRIPKYGRGYGYLHIPEPRS